MVLFSTAIGQSNGSVLKTFALSFPEEPMMQKLDQGAGDFQWLKPLIKGSISH